MFDFYNSRMGVAIRNYVYSHAFWFFMDLCRRLFMKRTRLKQRIRYLESELQRLNGESP